MLQLVVAGDIVIDHHIYEGERGKPGEEVAGVVQTEVPGGASLLAELIGRVLERSGWDVQLGVETTISRCGSSLEPSIQHAYALWAPQDEPGTPGGIWRTDRLLGYGDGAQGEVLGAKGIKDPIDLLVLDDAGSDFRRQPQQPCWHLQDKAKEGWIVLKLSDPVAHGDLWSALVQRQLHRERFVCLISVADLRRQDSGASPGLSWERTVDEVRAALNSHPVLSILKQCRHLVITFASDGALWVDRMSQTASLVFDPAGFEGGWSERYRAEVIGGMSAMTASLVRYLAEHISKGAAGAFSLDAAIRAGLGAMRQLQRSGHGPADKPSAGYPSHQLAQTIRTGEGGPFASVCVPWVQPPPESWSIVEASQHPPDIHPAVPTAGLAREIVLYGERALVSIPHARVGRSVIIDRPEIEALRGLRRAMQDYRDAKAPDPSSGPTKPYSIGVFGPPGSGKSYGVKQLAKELFGEAGWLEFNLSQFTQPSELRSAFHQVRDVILSGRTPVVFWDEFDSNDYGWLRHLLAPMQDGRFQDGQLNHAIGKAVFVFAGGTSERYADFGPILENEAAQQRFRMLKGPDFLSRLDAYFDVAGPNQRRCRVVSDDGAAAVVSYVADEADVTYPLRRALLIRHHLGCTPQERLVFDSDLLDALLLVPRYRHGSRSLEKLVKPLRPQLGGAVRRSALPASERIAMHVDAQAFHQMLVRLNAYRSNPGLQHIAAGIYAGWLAVEQTNRGAQKGDRSYDELEEQEKDANRASALRLPEVLALAGMTVSVCAPSNAQLSQEVVERMIAHRLEIMAEAEHDGWERHRRANGWRYAPTRDLARRRHEMLKSYAELPSKNQEKDKDNVRASFGRLRAAGFSICWLAPPGSG